MHSTPITINTWSDRIVIVRNNDGEHIELSLDDALTLANKLTTIVAQRRKRDRLSERTNNEREQQ